MKIVFRNIQILISAVGNPSRKEFIVYKRIT